MQTDAQISDGSVLRMDPITGRRRVISGADYARTQLTRERDNELAMQAGAPPIAQGGNRYRTDNRALNVARAKADGQFDSKRAIFNANNSSRQMDDAGEIRQIPKPAAPAPSSPPAPAASGTLAPSAPSNPNSSPAGIAHKAPPPSFAGPAAPTNPNLPASYDRPMQNVQFAAGPNISTAPTGLPQGSVGFQRKDGSHSVNTADGQTRNFANEASARAVFAPAAAPATAAQRQDAAPDAASQAWAANSSGRFAYMDAARQPAALAPAQPSATAAPAATFAQMRQQAVPVSPVTPSPAAQAGAAAQAPRRMSTPTNIPPANFAASPSRTGAGRLSDVAAAFAAPFKAAGDALDSIRMDPADSAKFEAARRDRIKGVTYRPEGLGSEPVNIPGSVMNPDMDAGAVPAARFYEEDEDPTVFPTLSGSAGSSRPRAIFA